MSTSSLFFEETQSGNRNITNKFFLREKLEKNKNHLKKKTTKVGKSPMPNVQLQIIVIIEIRRHYKKAPVSKRTE